MAGMELRAGFGVCPWIAEVTAKSRPKAMRKKKVRLCIVLSSGFFSRATVYSSTTVRAYRNEHGEIAWNQAALLDSRSGHVELQPFGSAAGGCIPPIGMVFRIILHNYVYSGSVNYTYIPDIVQFE